MKSVLYQTPKIEALFINVESGFAASLENPIVEPETSWQ